MVNRQRGDVEDNIHHVGVQDHEVEREGKGHSQQQPGVALKLSFIIECYKVLKILKDIKRKLLGSFTQSNF